MVRFCWATLFRASGSTLLCVIWTRYLMRLSFAIVLAIGRLIRRCAPTLRKKNLRFRGELVMRNLIALVLMHLTVCVSDVVVTHTCLFASGVRLGDGDLLMTPRRWCRTEYLCLKRRMIWLRALLKIRILMRWVVVRQCLRNMALLLKVDAVLWCVVVMDLMTLSELLMTCTFPFLLLVEVPISNGHLMLLFVVWTLLLEVLLVTLVLGMSGRLVLVVSCPVLIPSVTV